MSDQTAPTYLEPLRDELDRLRTELFRVATEWVDEKRRAERAETDLEQAEQRINDLMARLDDRSAALNRTGASNDRLRAALTDLAQHGTRYDLNPTHLVGDETFWLGYITRMDSGVRERARIALADQEPA